MRDLGGPDLILRDDHARADAGHAPQALREFARQPDAAVRRRIAGQPALVHRHARPGDALHVGHRRVAVEVGAVMQVLLDHAEHALRRRMAGHAGRDRRMRERLAVGIDGEPLLLDRDQDAERACRHLLRRLRDRGGLGAFLDFLPGMRCAPGSAMPCWTGATARALVPGLAAGSGSKNQRACAGLAARIIAERLAAIITRRRMPACPIKSSRTSSLPSPSSLNPRIRPRHFSRGRADPIKPSRRPARHGRCRAVASRQHRPRNPCGSGPERDR